MKAASSKAAWLALAALLLLPASAGAYTYRTVNGHIERWDASGLTMVVNTNGMPTGALDAIKAAMATWSGAGANFTFVYGGASSSTAYGTSDDDNLIDFGPLSSSTTIAQNHWWYNSRNGQLIDSDIRLNESLSWSTTGDENSYDVQSIVTHEMGHSLVLGDLYGSGDKDKTMYGYGYKGELKQRTLDDDDINGIRFLYP